LVARRLFERGAKHLVLVGRNPPSAAAAAVISELRAAGADVSVESADVGVEAEVNALIGRICSKMPPLRGVVHAAGTFDAEMIVNASWARFGRVLAPKTLGGWNMHRATRGLPLDFFVLFSSAAAICWQIGAASYASANTSLDALAHYRHGLGLPATAINWGLWWRSGIDAFIGTKQAVRSGIRPMLEQECLKAFERIAGIEKPQYAAMDIDWTRFRESSSQRLAFYTEVLEERSTLDATHTTVQSAKNVLDIILAKPQAERELAVRECLAREAAMVLQLPHRELDVDRPLVDFGLDSLMAVQLRNRIERALGVAISVGRILDDASAAGLAAEVATQLASGTRPDGTLLPLKEASTVSVDNLTDDEVESMLASLLAARSSE
jgi:aryl carrier-like protein